MEALETLRAALPDAARDIRLNIQSVLKDGALSEPQRWARASWRTPARPLRSWR